MKNKLLTTIFFSIFFLSSQAAEKQDCSVFKKISKNYLKCKTSNLKLATSELKFDASNIKEKKYLTDWFKKKK